VASGSRRAIIAAFLANAGIALAKFAAWLATGAAAMLAEAVHSLADTSNQALLLLGAARARRRATPEHPFGYGAERFFWAFVVAMMLFLAGGIFAIYEGASKLRHPHELDSPGWAVGVLLVAIGLESASFRVALRESEPLRGGASWWSFVRRSKIPELPVVLLEDAGALLGLLLALAGVGLSMLTGNPVWDAAASIAIGGLLCVIAVVLAAEMKSLLIGESASARHEGGIREALESAPGVQRLIHLRTLHIGPEQIFVGAKIEFDAALDLAGVAGAIDAAETRVRERVPGVSIMYLEPDLHDPSRRD
jgi:cation diffusion facilitator family transporter